MSISVNAQLIVNWDKKVSVGVEKVEFEPLLMAGDYWCFDETCDTSIGTGGAPSVGNNNNIGVSGRVSTNTSFFNDCVFGVIGKARKVNGTHGRNYGLCGMIDDVECSNCYGGAGIYATDYDYYYSMPTNIQGAYAAYFKGSVYVAGNLTVNSMFTPSDRRLNNNVVSLSRSKRSGMTTLENLLNMNVVEYNLKGRQFEDISENVDPEKAEELRQELESLKKEDQKMTSRRHFGVDANELQKVYPDLVLESKDGYLSVNYLEMVPLVIRSIQELKEELDDLKDAEDE
jgi:hypothetical protein